MSRLDRRLRDAHPDLSWRQIRDAIEQGQVTVDGRVERDPAHAVAARADVNLNRNRPAQRRTRAPFSILHEDDEILVIDKPAGLLTVPTSPEHGDLEDSVLRRAREYVAHRHGRQSYVGMLHRLDRDTSGALAIALSREAHAAGRELFRHHRFERRYLALVTGVPARDRGTIESRISSDYRAGRRRNVSDQQAGLDAATDYVVREQFQGASLLELQLHTGRQHQIRLHLEKLGHPLLGEKVYGVGNPNRLRRGYGESAGALSAKAEGLPPQARSGDKPSGLSRSAPSGDNALGLSRQPRSGDKPLGLSRQHKGLSRQMLHAWTLAFPHPITNAQISVEAPLPKDFDRVLATLRKT